MPTYSTLILLLHTFWTKNLDYLTSFKQILFFKTSTAFLNLADFWNIVISQGSQAIYLKRYGGLYTDNFGDNFVRSLAVKGVWKSINMSRIYRPE